MAAVDASSKAERMRTSSFLRTSNRLAAATVPATAHDAAEQRKRERRYPWRKGTHVGLACSPLVLSRRFMMGRPKIMLLALAMTFAPALVRAGDANPPPPAPQVEPGEPSTLDGQGTPPDHTGTQTPGSTGWTGGSQEQNRTDPRVGSPA